MTDGSLLVIAIAAGLAIILYWWLSISRRTPRRPQQLTVVTVILVVFGFIACGWSVALDRAGHSYTRQNNPLAIAIAFDHSPSMLAIPDPFFKNDVPPRYERARVAVLELFKTLEERQKNALVALIGFTRNAEVLMGWDDNAAQVRDILEHGLSPELFTSTGTSIETVVKKIIDTFNMLPQDMQATSRKIAILVSDGEDTQAEESFAYALEDLASSSFDLIALQVGSLSDSEGVPRYGQIGEFLGFESMGGKLYTVPDFEAMSALSNATAQRGLFVRAEDPRAVEKMLQFLNQQAVDDGKPATSLLATLALFTLVGLFCARVL